MLARLLGFSLFSLFFFLSKKEEHDDRNEAESGSVGQPVNLIRPFRTPERCRLASFVHFSYSYSTVVSDGLFLSIKPARRLRCVVTRAFQIDARRSRIKATDDEGVVKRKLTKSFS